MSPLGHGLNYKRSFVSDVVESCLSLAIHPGFQRKVKNTPPSGDGRWSFPVSTEVSVSTWWLRWSRFVESDILFTGLLLGKLIWVKGYYCFLWKFRLGIKKEPRKKRSFIYRLWTMSPSRRISLTPSPHTAMWLLHTMYSWSPCWLLTVGNYLKLKGTLSPVSP